MENRKYTLRYLPGFQEDLMECVRYISNNLQNPPAAEKLINDKVMAPRSRCHNY